MREAGAPTIPRDGVRHEVKYFVPHDARTALRFDLQALLGVDPNSNEDGEGYGVESLYFDTHRRENYTEKLDGVPHRLKFRVRQYGADSHTRMLELKERLGTGQRKRRTRLDDTGYRALLAGHLAGADDPVLRAFRVYRARTALRPWLIVSYRRLAFLARAHKDVRVTLDRDVRCRFARDFERPMSAGVPVLPAGISIAEFKWADTFPDWLQALTRKYGLRNFAISKYCLAMDALVRRGILPDV